MSYFGFGISDFGFRTLDCGVTLMFYSAIRNPKSQIRNDATPQSAPHKTPSPDFAASSFRDGLAVAGKQVAREVLLDLRELDREADLVLRFAGLAEHFVLRTVAVRIEDTGHFTQFVDFQLQLAKRRPSSWSLYSPLK